METAPGTGAAWNFYRQKESKRKKAEELQAELYRQIGQLKVELDWVKKKSELLC